MEPPISAASLPPELILQLFVHLDPGSHFDFACACKYIYQCARPVLARHESAYEKYSTASDILPSTVPHLVRSALGLSDPVDAWHVRSFEVWDLRLAWKDWTAADWWKHGNVVGSRRTVPYTFPEAVRRDILEASRSLLPLSAEQRAKSELGEGGDGFLKMVLIAKCPRLRDLKIVRSVPSAAPLFDWLNGAMSHASDSPSQTPGLVGLRSIAVGLDVEEWVDPSSDAEVYRTYDTRLLMGFFSLPNLDMVYFSDLHYPTDRDGYLANPDLMKRATSSVRHLFIDRISDVLFTLLDPVLTAPRHLVSLTFLDCGGMEGMHGLHDVVATLAWGQSRSIESLISYHLRGMRAWDSGAYDPGQLPNRDWECQRHISIDVAEVGRHAHEMHEIRRLRREGSSVDSWFNSLFRDMCPRSLEALVLYGFARRPLDMVIAALIESAGARNSRPFSSRGSGIPRPA